MFGLDARIALAIFGALSVISGAALYSAIQDAKVTSFYTSMLEVEKAIIALKLDTGGMTQVGSGASADVNMADLIRNDTNRPGWKGPYLEGYHESLHHTYVRNKKMLVSFFNNVSSLSGCLSVSRVDGGDSYLALSHVDDSGSACHSDPDFLRKVHDKYDSDGDYNAGTLMVKTGSSTRGSLFYKISNDLK